MSVEPSDSAATPRAQGDAPQRVTERRHIIRGDLDGMEFAIADYIMRWGQHLPGVHPDTIAGTPCAVANMAMTVIRKRLITSWSEDVLIEGEPT